jgi:hypothetical protein
VWGTPQALPLIHSHHWHHYAPGHIQSAPERIHPIHTIYSIHTIPSIPPLRTREVDNWGKIQYDVDISMKENPR